MTARLPLAELRARIRTLEGAGSVTPGPALSLGLAAIDRHLPQGGLGLGQVHELARDGPGQSGAVTGFATALLGRRIGAGPILWCGRHLDLYGPGLSGLGLDPGRLILARPRSQADLLWTMEEGLRTRGLAAVVGEVAGAVDLGASRRLQLAAEAGGGLGLVLDGVPAGDGSGLAANALTTRWRVAALPAGSTAEGIGIGRARWRLSLWRCRGGSPGIWDVEWNDETGDFALVAALADRPRQARPPALARAG